MAALRPHRRHPRQSGSPTCSPSSSPRVRCPRLRPREPAQRLRINTAPPARCWRSAAR